MNSQTIDKKLDNGSPWLGSPIKFGDTCTTESLYYDCDTDLSGLGVCLQQTLYVQPPPAAANDTFLVQNENKNEVDPASFQTFAVESDAEQTFNLEPVAEQSFNLFEPTAEQTLHVETAASQSFSMESYISEEIQKEEARRRALLVEKENAEKDFTELRDKIQEKDLVIQSLLDEQNVKSAEEMRIDECKRKMTERLNEFKELTERLQTVTQEKHDIKEDCKELVKEVNLCEDSFSLLHRNYEKVKVLLENFNRNEQLLNLRNEQMEKLALHRDRKIEHIKQKSEESILMAKRDYDSKLRDVEAENSKLKAMICMSEVQLRQLEAGVTQKNREVEQLRELCEELIKGKAG